MTTERDIRNQIAYARKEGLEQGREEGREEGAQEKAVFIARNLLQAGVPSDIIARTTGLSPEAIREAGLQ